MEYCSNGDLWTQVEAYGPPCSDVACTWMWQISSALDFLHNMHVIHRDLKPNNVLLDQHLTCKVADFGLARVFDEEGQVCVRVHMCQGVCARVRVRACVCVLRVSFCNEFA